MAELLFKRGSQAGFNALQSFTDGAFYLTTDTNRLYVGKSDNTAALLNQTVQIVKDMAALNALTNVAKNDFYYLTDDNILAVYTGTEWVQINPDHNDNDNTDTVVTEVNLVKDTTKSTNEKLIFNVNLTDKLVDNLSGEDIKINESRVVGSFELTQNDINAITPDAASVYLDASEHENGAVIKAAGTGSNDAKDIILKEGSNVTIEVVAGDNQDVITISAKDDNTTYGLGNIENDKAVAKVILTDSASQSEAIEFKAGKDLEVSASAGTITYKHVDTYGDINDAPIDNKTLAFGQTFDVATGLVTSNGHVTGVNKTTYTLPALPTDEHVVAGEYKWNSTDKNVKLSLASGAEVEISGLDFYTQNEVDNAIKALNDRHDAELRKLNSLTYKGVVPATGLPSDGVKVGDMYMVDANSTINGENAEKGDLFIATGTEDEATGYITGAIEWTYIPAGDDIHTDSQFALEVSGQDSIDTQIGQFDIKLKNTTSNEDAKDSDSLTVKAGTDIVIDWDGTSNTATIEHKVYAAPTSEEGKVDGTSFTAVTGVTTENGHVTGWTTETFTLPEDKDTTYTLNGNDDKITLTDSSNAAAGSIEVAGGNEWIVTDVTDNKLTASHKTVAVDSTAGENITPAFGTGSFDIISAVTVDGAGHVTKYVPTKITLPALPEDKDTTYQLSGATSTDAAFTVTLTDKASQVTTASVQMVSNSANLTIMGNSANNQIAFGLVWDTF